MFASLSFIFLRGLGLFVYCWLFPCSYGPLNQIDSTRESLSKLQIDVEKSNSDFESSKVCSFESLPRPWAIELDRHFSRWLKTLSLFDSVCLLYFCFCQRLPYLLKLVLPICCIEFSVYFVLSIDEFNLSVAYSRSSTRSQILLKKMSWLHKLSWHPCK